MVNQWPLYRLVFGFESCLVTADCSRFSCSEWSEKVVWGGEREIERGMNEVYM